MIRKYKDGGILPKWELHGHYTGTMIGFPAISIIADAMVKGMNVDAQEALDAAEFTARYHKKGEFPDWTEDQNIGAASIAQLEVYEQNGYVHWGYWNSTSYTLEFAYGDWALSEIARMAGNNKVQQEFLNRSNNYLNHWDATTGFFRPKNHPDSWNPHRPASQFNQPVDENSPDCKLETVNKPDGTSVEMRVCPLLPFDPYYVDEFAYTEGNSWQWKFQPLHAFKWLKAEVGGEKGLREDLDELFNARSSNSGEALPDLTGYIGQYMHGN